MVDEYQYSPDSLQSSSFQSTTWPLGETSVRYVSNSLLPTERVTCSPSLPVNIHSCTREPSLKFWPLDSSSMPGDGSQGVSRPMLPGRIDGATSCAIALPVNAASAASAIAWGRVERTILLRFITCLQCG